MVLLDVLGLGVSELIIIIIAIVLLIEPRNMVYIKPVVKVAYKIWLSYRAEVEKAQREMEGVRQDMMEPILSAKREVESEISQAGTKNRKLGETLLNEIKEAKGELQKAKGELEKAKRGHPAPSGAGPGALAKGPGKSEPEAVAGAKTPPVATPSEPPSGKEKPENQKKKPKTGRGAQTEGGE